MGLLLTNTADCKAYFTTIAQRHKEIDDFRWGDEEVIQKASKVLARRVLWVKPYDGAKFTGIEDNLFKMKVLELRYMKPPVSAKQSDIELSVAETEAVISQILAKMFLDKRGYFDAGVYQHISFKPSSLETENIEWTLGSTRYVGCELRMELQENSGLIYDETKWDD